MQGFTVGEVARATGVTVRTLHHYDEIGLLPPTGRTAAGYRLYSDGDVRLLHHIRTYHLLGFSLEEVAALLKGSEREAMEQLRRQHHLIGERIDQLREVQRMIDTMMEAEMDDVRLTPEEMFDVFGDHDPSTHVEETRERWGETDAYAESRRRTTAYSSTDWRSIKAEIDHIEADFAALLTSGAAADSAGAVSLAERHRQHIDRWFYPCSTEMHCGLADMYVTDRRFTEHYDRRGDGLAEFVRDAIYANADRSASGP